MRRTSIDLNADVGEGFATDAELIPLVSSVNIACGGHAGDEKTMADTVALAFRHGVAIGAHPGFEDREHFGRREISISPREAVLLVTRQARLLQVVAEKLGAVVGHVKLHGALYNMACADRGLATALAAAIMERSVEESGPSVVFALAGSPFMEIGREMGLTMIGEAFADRLYMSDGTLTPRSRPGAVLGHAVATAQALTLAQEGSVIAGDKVKVVFDAGTLCLHGDSPEAVESAKDIRRSLGLHGISVRSY
jgi:5-oxoprolinase (ATP-hydrolysing) subunit A